MGLIELQGKVDKFIVLKKDKTFSAGTVPVGSYRIRYQFGSRPMRTIPNVNVTAKNKKVIFCDDTMMLCWVKK